MKKKKTKYNFITYENVLPSFIEQQARKKNTKQNKLKFNKLKNYVISIENKYANHRENSH